MNIQRILVSGRIWEEMQRRIEALGLQKQFRFLPEQEVQEEDFAWADAYVGFRPPARFTFGSLKWVHSLGAGVDSFLIDRDWKKDVLLTRTICSFGNKISEYCLSYILRDLQLHVAFQKEQHQKSWSVLEPRMLQTQTIVIFGTGVIGQEIAKTLSFFGVKTIGVSRTATKKPYFQQIVKISEIERILPLADWVISTLPLTRNTYQYYSHSFFQHLQGAGFINVGRGKTVQEDALLEALANQAVRLAVLDVFTEEPLPQHSPLWDHANVIITPHISAITSPKEAVQCFLDTLSGLEAGRKLSNQVKVEEGY